MRITQPGSPAPTGTATQQSALRIRIPDPGECQHIRGEAINLSYVAVAGVGSRRPASRVRPPEPGIAARSRRHGASQLRVRCRRWGFVSPYAWTSACHGGVSLGHSGTATGPSPPLPSARKPDRASGRVLPVLVDQALRRIRNVHEVAVCAQTAVSEQLSSRAARRACSLNHTATPSAIIIA